MAGDARDRKELEYELKRLFLERPKSLPEAEALLRRARDLGDPSVVFQSLLLLASVDPSLAASSGTNPSLQEAAAILEAEPDIELPPWAQWRYLYRLAFMRDSQGSHGEAALIAAQSAELANKLGMLNQEAESLALLGWIEAQQDRALECVDYSSRAIALGESGTFAVGHGYWNLAILFDAHGAYGDALEMMQAAIAVGHDNPITQAIDLIELHRFAINAGRSDIAISSLAEAAEIVQRPGMPAHLATRLRVAEARGDSRAGDFDTAEAKLLVAIRDATGAGFPKRIEEARLELMRLASERGDAGAVIAIGAEANAVLLPPPARIAAFEFRAKALEDLGELAAANQLLRQALELQRSTFEAGRQLVRTMELTADNERISSQNDQLAIRNLELAELQRENSEVLSLVAHDLRGSLGTLMLAAKANGKSSERLVGSVERFSRIISQLGEAVDLESGDHERAPLGVDLVEVLNDVLAEADDVAAEKGIALARDILIESAPVTVISEPEAASVVRNLMSNAVKFCAAGDEIHVALRLDGDSFELAVADTGPGIEPHDHERVFGKFERLDRRPTDGEPTSGLGLFIVNRLVRRAGGSCGVESAGAGQGSRFWVHLPVPVNESLSAESSNGVA